MNRKYQQRGYMESERENRERGKPPPRKELTKEERIHKKGLRHAIDRDAREVLRCHNCGRDVQNLGAITVETRCPACGAPLRCCRGCQHFDTAARRQCRADIAEPIGDKTKPNACPKFQACLVLDATGRRTGGSSTSRTGDPRAQFENLFKS